MTTIELQRPIVIHYLKTGRFITIRELAESVLYSESAIRQNLEGNVAGIKMRKERRDTFSRMYPKFRHGKVVVNCYGPTRKLLRQMLAQELGIDTNEEAPNV